jgi:hypothetical protein
MAFNPDGPVPVNKKPQPSPGGPKPKPNPTKGAETLPYVHKKNEPKQPPTPIPNATAKPGPHPHVTPAASQLGAVNHPNDRTGSRAYAGLTGHAAPNMLTDLHAAHATPGHLK